MRNRGAVGVHGHEARKGVECRTAEVVAVIEILAVEEFDVGSQFQPRLDLYVHLRAGVERVIVIRANTENTVLMVVTSADHIGDILGASGDIDIIVLGRTGFVEHVVVPVEIGKVNIRELAVAHLCHYPRSFRVLHFVVPPLPEPLVVIVCIARIWYAALG